SHEHWSGGRGGGGGGGGLGRVYGYGGSYGGYGGGLGGLGLLGLLGLSGMAMANQYGYGYNQNPYGYGYGQNMYDQSSACSAQFSHYSNGSPVYLCYCPGYGTSYQYLRCMPGLAGKKK
ncbi:hypothetical protein OESDEN_20088, partial [Oesophagostomum dentatum]